MNSKKLSAKGTNNFEGVKVTLEQTDLPFKTYYFKKSFTVGRSDDCSIQIDNGLVSRVHLEIIKEGNLWSVIDRQSSNGTFLNGVKIDRIELNNSTILELGKKGPVLHFKFEEHTDNEYKNFPLHSSMDPGAAALNKNETKETQIHSGPDDPSLTKYIRHYFDETSEENIGAHTRLMREAFKVVKKKQSSKYIRIIFAVAITAILVGAYALFQHLKENRQKQLAENIFYSMKELELEIASLKETLADSKDPAVLDALKKFDERYHLLGNNYEKLVDELDVYDLSEEDKLIVKTARIFGECEFAIPPGFISEVKNYIKKWQSTSRYEKAVERASKNGYTQLIVNYFVSNKLPHQFFYLALQESDFIEQRVGPETRFGYAKGIWMFISETAKRYGLKTGPLSDKNHYDPGDDRFNLPKATSAAARYIKDIYNTDAQASGLLVMASYNWGEHRVINYIRKMPASPRERNFWKFLEKHRDNMPDETYNYVFHIFSAAVIGENPRLFGFDFDNPLKTALANASLN